LALGSPFATVTPAGTAWTPKRTCVTGGQCPSVACGHRVDA
jgi:hypothetical protein